MHCASVSRFPFVLTTMHGLPGQIIQHTLGCHPLADSPGIIEWLQLETTMATASGVLEIATPFRDIALWWRDRKVGICWKPFKVENPTGHICQQHLQSRQCQSPNSLKLSYSHGMSLSGALVHHPISSLCSSTPHTFATDRLFLVAAYTAMYCTLLQMH